MTKPLLGLLIGAILGLFDGATALAYPINMDDFPIIVVSSTIKGLIAGWVAGIFARKTRSIPLGILLGLAVGGVLSYLASLGAAYEDGTRVFWPIMIPGTLVGAIAGFATQKWGKAAPLAA